MAERADRRVAVALLGVVLFCSPLLAIFDRDLTVFGVPLLWAYLFAGWAALIGLLAATAGRTR
jgi:hypothetical protein